MEALVQDSKSYYVVPSALWLCVVWCVTDTLFAGAYQLEIIIIR